MPMTPAERSMRARVAAHRSWAATADPAARTAPARMKMLDRFVEEVDPQRILQPAERNRRAESARSAYMTGLALKSAVARRHAREALTVAESAEAELKNAA